MLGQVEQEPDPIVTDTDKEWRQRLVSCVLVWLEFTKQKQNLREKILDGGTVLLSDR